MSFGCNWSIESRFRIKLSDVFLTISDALLVQSEYIALVTFWIQYRDSVVDCSTTIGIKHCLRVLSSSRHDCNDWNMSFELCLDSESNLLDSDLRKTAGSVAIRSGVSGQVLFKLELLPACTHPTSQADLNFQECCIRLHSTFLWYRILTLCAQANIGVLCALTKKKKKGRGINFQRVALPSGLSRVTVFCCC